MSAQRIQAYLDKHKIGALFEDLMSKLIRDTPDEPIPYLMKILQKIDAKQRPSPFKEKPKPLTSSMTSPQSRRREFGLSGTPVTLRSLQDESLLRGGKHSSWAETDLKENGIKDALPPRPGSGKHRDYSRPWTANSKQLNKSKSSSTENLTSDAENMRPQGRQSQKSSQRQSWDKSTIVPTHDFDEWFNVQHRGNPETREKLSSSFSGRGWGEANEESSKELEKLRAIQTIHRRRAPISTNDDDSEVNFDNDLDKELSIALKMRLNEDKQETSSTLSTSSTGSYKCKHSAKYQAEERKRQLQAMLISEKASSRSGVNMSEAVTDDSPDEGTELMENYDDLQNEGVLGQKSKGSKPSKMSRLTQPVDEPVKVSICARCARIITGQQSADDQSSDADTIQPFHSSTRLSDSQSASEVDFDDDNFESASQVGEARMPVSIWPVDSESEASPRKGKHMYKPPQAKPVKGKHMYRDTSIIPNFDSRPSTARTYSVESDDDKSNGVNPKYPWNRNVQFSDEETDNASFGGRQSPTFKDRKPWNMTARYADDTDSETGSDAPWKSPSKSKQPTGYKTFITDDTSSIGP